MMFVRRDILCILSAYKLLQPPQFIVNAAQQYNLRVLETYLIKFYKHHVEFFYSSLI